jgi:RNA polymerase sigma factor (sigma-70 family)
VFQSISSFKFEGELAGWIKKIMVNTALAELRKKKMEFEKLDDDYSENDNEHQQADSHHDVKDLLRMLQQLPHGYRTIFNLYAIEGYTHKEIAERLAINEGTSKSQYARARTYIQKMLEGVKQFREPSLGER